MRKLKREEVLKEKRSRGSAGSPPFLVVSTDNMNVVLDAKCKLCKPRKVKCCEFGERLCLLTSVPTECYVIDSDNICNTF